MSLCAKLESKSAFIKIRTWLPLQELYANEETAFRRLIADIADSLLSL